MRQEHHLQAPQRHGQDTGRTDCGRTEKRVLQKRLHAGLKGTKEGLPGVREPEKLHLSWSLKDHFTKRRKEERVQTKAASNEAAKVWSGWQRRLRVVWT